jgi:hypothetical protein
MVFSFENTSEATPFRLIDQANHVTLNLNNIVPWRGDGADGATSRSGTVH